MRTYLVQPGDTLWALAAQFHGALSQTDYVDLLVEVNGGATIQTGQQIVLP
jgi:predicted Zn-dependent protease